MAQKICCPQCGNEELQVINETNVHSKGKNFSAGKGCLGYLLLGPLGILCGACGRGQRTSTTSTTYWICPKCGTKFRNPTDVEVEAASKKRTSAILIFSLLYLLLIAVFAIVSDLVGGFGILGPAGLLLLTVLFIVFMIVYTRRKR